MNERSLDSEFETLACGHEIRIVMPAGLAATPQFYINVNNLRIIHESRQCELPGFGDVKINPLHQE